jgi:hypothetical protein
VAKRAPTNFHVELTGYGWSVKVGADQLGLFTTQQQALEDVKRRRRAMKVEGRDSTVSVSGVDDTAPRLWSYSSRKR